MRMPLLEFQMKDILLDQNHCDEKVLENLGIQNRLISLE